MVLVKQPFFFSTHTSLSLNIDFLLSLDALIVYLDFIRWE